ncbi:MAG: hypothetical protein Q9227_005885 [Pyrenula ochraceoflavens]
MSIGVAIIGGDSTSVTLYSDDSGAGKTYDDLLARDDVNAVIIALPILNQPEYIKKALLRGKHVSDPRLSEKPVAKDIATATSLISWYRSTIDPSKVSWAVAENFRYLNTLDTAAEVVPSMGRILGFHLHLYSLTEPGGKYFETAWRKTPDHQGGFLLDAGVHFIAGIRLLLGKENPVTNLSAQTVQLQKHLPPVDTVDAALKARNGATGTMSMSFGTTFSGMEWKVACEKGVVSVSNGSVKIGEKEKKVEDEASGVPPEVRAWGKALSEGKVNERQSPEEALADLEILEAMLKSGENGGERVELNHQVV